MFDDIASCQIATAPWMRQSTSWFAASGGQERAGEAINDDSRRDFIAGAAAIGAASAGTALRAERLGPAGKMAENGGNSARRPRPLLQQIASDLALMERIVHLQTGSPGDNALARHLEQALTAAGFATARQQVTAPLAQCVPPRIAGKAAPPALPAVHSSDARGNIQRHAGTA